MLLCDKYDYDFTTCANTDLVASYCNSIIQCLYYSAPFRDHVVNFPSGSTALDSAQLKTRSSFSPLATSTTPYPNVSSPARKVIAPSSPLPGGGKAEESKETADYKKRMALQAGPVLSMTHDRSGRYGMEESLFTSLRDIFESIIDSPSRIGVVSPHRFLEILRRDNEMFRSAMHQDAHEFLNYVLNSVVDEVDLFVKKNPDLVKKLAIKQNGSTSNGASEDSSPDNSGALVKSNIRPLDQKWVHDIFEGRLTSETRCLTCETTSQRDEPFLDLSVDLAPHTSVTACLRKFSEEEMLCERNKFHCDTCGGLQEAEKRMKIKRLPRVLALHLKRFKYTEAVASNGIVGGLTDGFYAAQRLHKLFHRVVYPFHLRLFDTTDDAADPDRLYELYAVVVHIGGGPYHGHYVSIVKTHDRGWLLFDDELVEPVDESYVLSFFGGEPVPGANDPRQLACAYVLFYQETTLEAVTSEQEMRAQPPATTAASTAAADEIRKSAEAEAADMLKQPNGFHRANTSNSFSVDEMLGADSIDPVRKTRKETRQEITTRRIDALKRAESNLKMNGKSGADAPLTAEHDATDVKELESVGRPSIGDHSKSKDKEGGLSRFRHGNMSLRGTTRLFSSGNGKNKPVKGEEKLNEKGSSGQLQNATDSDATHTASSSVVSADEDYSMLTQPVNERATRAAGTRDESHPSPSALPSSPPMKSHSPNHLYALSNASSSTPPTSSHGVSSSDPTSRIPSKPTRRTTFGYFSRSDKSKDKGKQSGPTSAPMNETGQLSLLSTPSTVNGGPTSVASTNGSSIDTNVLTNKSLPRPPPSSSSTSSSLGPNLRTSAVQNHDHAPSPLSQPQPHHQNQHQQESEPTALPTFNLNSSTTSPAIPPTPVHAEEKAVKRHRFSLGRKKTSAVT
jgi:ubiquitin carboxyl-terminal hydrolase 9/13